MGLRRVSLTFEVGRLTCCLGILKQIKHRKEISRLNDNKNSKENCLNNDPVFNHP